MATITLNGSTSGYVNLTVPAAAGTNTITFPASTGTVVLTSGATFSGAVSFGSTTTYAGNLTYTTPSTTTALYEYWNNGSINVAAIVGYSDSSTAGHLEFHTTTGSTLTERMRIDSSGNVNIGTTGVATQLYVNKNAASGSSALTDAATIAVDMSLANNFTVTLGGNRTLGNPTNLTVGQSGVIFVTQDSTGSRTLAYSSYWKFPNGVAPVLTTTASAVDAIYYTVRTSTSITASYALNIG